MKIVSRATPEGLACHGLSTTALCHKNFTSSENQERKAVRVSYHVTQQ